MRVRLTQKMLEPPFQVAPGRSREEWCDKEVPGLYVEVRATNPDWATYYLRYRNRQNKTSHERLGRTSELTLVQVRAKAKQIQAEIRLGADPRGEAKAQKEVPTLDAFFIEQYAPFAKPRKRSFVRDAQLHRRIKDRFGSRRLNQISRQQVQSFHTELLHSGLAPATCDHHLKLLKRIFNLAIDWGVHAGANPVSRVPMFNADNRVQCLLDDSQLQRLVSVLQKDSNRAVCDIALYLLSTGARLNEALSARWEYVDRDNRVWTIPATDSKSKRGRAVPLSDSALEVLSRQDTKSVHVFINRKTGKPYTTIAKVWDRLRKRAELPRLRIHDLRHTLASLMLNRGRTLLETQYILGHASHQTTLRYSHLSNKTMLDAANSASAAIKGAMNDVTAIDALPTAETPAREVA